MYYDDNKFEIELHKFLKKIRDEVAKEETPQYLKNNKTNENFNDTTLSKNSHFKNSNITNIWLSEFTKQVAIALTDEFVAKVIVNKLNSITVTLSENIVFKIDITKL